MHLMAQRNASVKPLAGALAPRLWIAEGDACASVENATLGGYEIAE